MEKDKLKELTAAELQSKSNSLKGIIGLFVFLSLALFFFAIRDYLNGKELDMAIVTIAICTLGGAATVYPQLKEVWEEVKSRT